MDTDTSKRQQFEPLVVEHHVRLRAFVRSLGVDPDWVDDIAQEALLTAYRQWERYDPQRDFGKWVRGIAANIVRNEIRKDTRRRRILHTELAEMLIERFVVSNEPTESVSIEAVQLCMNELTERSRRVIQGRYRDGLAAPELGDQLGLSSANVRQMLVRIRSQIKKCVEQRMATET